MQDILSASNPFSLFTNSEHIKPLKNIKLWSRWEILSLVILFSFQSMQARME